MKGLLKILLENVLNALLKLLRSLLGFETLCGCCAWLALHGCGRVGILEGSPGVNITYMITQHRHKMYLKDVSFISEILKCLASLVLGALEERNLAVLCKDVNKWEARR